MGSTIYVNKPKADAIRLENTTGVALVENEFTVLGGKAVKAMEAVASAAVGCFEDLLGKIVQAANFTSGEGTFATSNLPIYWNPSTKVFNNAATVGNYKVGYTIAPLASGVVEFVAIDPLLIASSLVDLAAADVALAAEIDDIKARGGVPFFKTATLTSAAAGTPVHVLTDAEVGAGNVARIAGMIMSVDGATAWTDSTGTIVKLQDTNGSPVVGISVAKAQLTGNASLGLHNTGVTLADPVKVQDGFTTAKGIDIVADSDFDAGSNIVVTIFGFIDAA